MPRPRVQAHPVVREKDRAVYVVIPTQQVLPASVTELAGACKTTRTVICVYYAGKADWGKYYYAVRGGTVSI